ncbi:uncharacterized protein LOC115451946 [Manduca sexta]|uniref:uncharacterized protein LOC115451946 n=1 Tax=Manduca sexta TaxID=7130 RepID=UPI0011830E1E|nr:uncharacterized protein LOC115451946 [Manduca sexta]
MTDIKVLRRKRGSCKARLTIFATYLSHLTDSELNPDQVLELQLRVDRFGELFDQFNDIQTQLECLSDNLDEEIIERSAFGSEYYALFAQAKNRLIVTKADEDDFKTTNSSSKRKVAQLPTINLPTFSGSYDNWLAFRDTFISLIHKDDDIDEINKFHYLKTSLEGSAADVIQSVDFSAENYSLAWDLLCGRFDNKRLLLQNHVSAIFDLNPLIKESSNNLKSMIDQINKHIRACEKLGEPVNGWDTLLIHLFSHKLDARTFREWEVYKKRLDKSKSILFKQFMEFMQERAQLSKTKKSPDIPTKHNAKLKSMVFLSDNINSFSYSFLCPECNGDHYLNTCPQFLALSIDERMSVLPKYKVCYNCFHRGHYPKNCKRSGCKVCNYKHHNILTINRRIARLIVDGPKCPHPRVPTTARLPLTLTRLHCQQILLHIRIQATRPTFFCRLL